MNTFFFLGYLEAITKVKKKSDYQLEFNQCRMFLNHTALIRNGFSSLSPTPGDYERQRRPAVVQLCYTMITGFSTPPTGQNEGRRLHHH